MLLVVHGNNGWDWSDLPDILQRITLVIDNEVIFKHVDHIIFKRVDRH